jgi:hypothetical protein
MWKPSMRLLSNLIVKLIGPHHSNLAPISSIETFSSVAKLDLRRNVERLNVEQLNVERLNVERLNVEQYYKMFECRTTECRTTQCRTRRNVEHGGMSNFTTLEITKRLKDPTPTPTPRQRQNGRQNGKKMN